MSTVGPKNAPKLLCCIHGAGPQLMHVGNEPIIIVEGYAIAPGPSGASPKSKKSLGLVFGWLVLLVIVGSCSSVINSAASMMLMSFVFLVFIFFLS